MQKPVDRKTTVIVASHNPAKIRAVQAAFASRLPGAVIEYRPVAVDSGVSDQPMSDAETRTGAINRTERARQAEPDADFWVGLEGGLDRIDDELRASAWMVALDRQGRRGEARTVMLPLPPKVLELVESGLELGEANDRIFSTLNSKTQGGAFGLLTDDEYTRESVYTEALVMALLPLTHPLYD